MIRRLAGSLSCLDNLCPVFVLFTHMDELEALLEKRPLTSTLTSLLEAERTMCLWSPAPRVQDKSGKIVDAPGVSEGDKIRELFQQEIRREFAALKEGGLSEWQQNALQCHLIPDHQCHGRTKHVLSQCANCGHSLPI